MGDCTTCLLQRMTRTSRCDCAMKVWQSRRRRDNSQLIVTVAHSIVRKKYKKSTNNTESSLLTSSKSRLGTCDNDGFTEVLRGPKPQTRVAPRAYAQQSRYTPLWNSPVVPEADDPPVDVDDTLMPASYVVQTRSRAPQAGSRPPTTIPEPHKTDDVQPTPADDLLVHRRHGHAKSHPYCLDRPMGKLQTRRTPYTRPTDPRPPTSAGFRIAGDMKGPLRPDINGNMWHLVLVDILSRGTFTPYPANCLQVSSKGS